MQEKQVEWTLGKNSLVRRRDTKFDSSASDQLTLNASEGLVGK
jgi:hypothetical protein